MHIHGESSYIGQRQDSKAKTTQNSCARVHAVIVRMVKKYPFKSSWPAAADINQSLALKISRRLVRKRLNQAKLLGLISRKKRSLSKKKIFQKDLSSPELKKND